MKADTKGSTRSQRVRYSPVQVYVSSDTVAMWAEVDKTVKALQKADASYSVSRFVNEAVQAKLAR
jgi:hypothetical protein